MCHAVLCLASKELEVEVVHIIQYVYVILSVSHFVYVFLLQLFTEYGRLAMEQSSDIKPFQV